MFNRYTCLQCFDAVGWVAGRASGLLTTEWWGAGVVICLERDADLHMAQLMPLPLTVSCFSKIQIGFTFLVQAHLGSPGQKDVKKVLLLLCVPYIQDSAGYFGVCGCNLALRFPGLSRKKLICQDFPGPGNFTNTIPGLCMRRGSRVEVQCEGCEVGGCRYRPVVW